MRDRTDGVREYGFTDRVLVCANGRKSECTDCVEANGSVVYDAVTSWLRDRGVFWSRVHIAETSCLDLCGADRAVVAIHPRSRWCSDIHPDDASTLLAEVFDPDASNLGVRPRD